MENVMLESGVMVAEMPCCASHPVKNVVWRVNFSKLT